MTSQTPIRLSSYRGPLATPPTSPESTPPCSIWSTPFTDISSHYSTSIRPAVDVTIRKPRTSTLNHPMRPRPRRRREVTKQTLLEFSGFHLCTLKLTFDSLIYWACDLAKSLVGTVTFCLLVWGLLEWAAYVSVLSRPPSSSWIVITQLPLPSPTRALRCHMSLSLCEPRDPHAAVLQFLSQQIQHAKALASLSASLGFPLRTFFAVHQAIIPRVIARRTPELPHLIQEVDTLMNLTESPDPSLVDFTPGSFIGRSFSLALEELDDLTSEPLVPRGPSTCKEHQDAHSHAIYWRTASNLLLEYSAARPRARKLLQRFQALHQKLSPLVSGHHGAGSIEGRSNILRTGGARHPPTAIDEAVQGFIAGLEVAIENARLLTAYLDWITGQLAQTTLIDVLNTRRRTDFSSCMASLQELFSQSKHSTSKRACFCLDDYKVTLPLRPERIDITVPGSPTVHAER